MNLSKPLKRSLRLTQPDDWHIHLRDNDALATTVKHAAAQFGRAIVMPNLKPPVTTVQAALAYRERIIQALAQPHSFQPLMTLYLTDNIAPEEVQRAKSVDAGQTIVAAKLYPAGATTNSDAGVTAIENIYPVLESMEKHGMLLLVHGEVTSADIDIFDREARFIEQQLIPLQQKFPGLKVVLEHITTQEAADYVTAGGVNGVNTAATITAHHLLYNRNALFLGGIRPHYYCLPVLKREVHRQALLKAATSGLPQFFLGTDSAPHASHLKEHALGCAGCYTAPLALELYAQAFDDVGAMDRLEGFASHFGADYYGLPRNTASVTLLEKSWTVPTHYEFGQATLTPLCSGQTLRWKLQ